VAIYFKYFYIIISIKTTYMGSYINQATKNCKLKMSINNSKKVKILLFYKSFWITLYITSIVNNIPTYYNISLYIIYKSFIIILIA